MFSPYYAWAGRKDPLNHCALNVALYGPTKRWAMTERGRNKVERTQSAFSVGGSHVEWDGSALTVHVDELAFPRMTRIKGTVRLHPVALPGKSFELDSDGKHLWQPIAPIARVEVDLDRPSLRWSGGGYLDSNSGSVPLEASFARWDWSRTGTSNDAMILYDVAGSDGGDRSLALLFDDQGRCRQFERPPRAPLPKGFWGVARGTRSHRGTEAKIIEGLEDGPFYTRSVLSHSLRGQRVKSVHESLSLDRFSTQLVKLMLPFRMPRVAG